MSEMLSERELLELEGTDPMDWSSDNLLALGSSDTIDRVNKLREMIPVIEKPYTKILAAISGDGRLEMETWHTCDTTHCIGGWAVTLAGVEGKKLEGKFETHDAAAMILRKSRPAAPLPNFYSRNEAALAFIRAQAAEEAK